MKLVRIDGELQLDSVNARMRRLLKAIAVERDRKRLKVLNRAYWREWFRTNRKAA